MRTSQRGVETADWKMHSDLHSTKTSRGRYSPSVLGSPSLLERFNDYLTFIPEHRRTDDKGRFSGTYQSLMNHAYDEKNPFNDTLANREEFRNFSPIADDFLFAEILPNSVHKFFSHQAHITIDPIAYAKGEGEHSLKRRAFDLMIGGSLAAIGETLYSIASIIISIGLLIFCVALGVKDKFKGEDDAFLYAKNAVKIVCYMTLSMVNSALRVAPLGVGVLLGHATHLTVAAVEKGVEKVGKRSDSRPIQIPKTVFVHHMHDDT